MIARGLGTLLLMLIGTMSHAQNLGVGLRFGDPSGITIKKYMGENALEVSFGRTHTIHGRKRGYYDNQFYDYCDNQNFDDCLYDGYSSSAPLGIQVHYLIHNSIDKLGEDQIEGLDWYYGFGGQLHFQRYKYNYFYKNPGNPDWIYVKGEQHTELELGPHAIIGLEYTFSDIPISIALDASIFVEIIDDPFFFWGQSGLSIRYNF